MLMYHIPLPEKENVHCLVPIDHVDIGTFVSNLRSNYKRFQTEPEASSLTTERIAKLNQLGFVWDASHEHAIFQSVKAF